METLVLATKNKGKIKEFTEAFSALGYEVVTIESLVGVDEPEETGTTFMENAMLKASYYMKASGHPCLADDSGLMVDYLLGAPGIYSARYGGAEKSDARNNEKLIRALRGVPKEQRRAHYVCALALANPDGTFVTAEGSCDGFIQDEPEGDGGFGYDPHFYVEEFGTTMANITVEQKQSISHRGKALAALVEALNQG